MTVDFGTEGFSFSVDFSLAVHWGFLFYAFIIVCVLGIKLHLNICKNGQNNNKIHKKTIYQTKGLHSTFSSETADSHSIKRDVGM